MKKTLLLGLALLLPGHTLPIKNEPRISQDAICVLTLISGVTLVAITFLVGNTYATKLQTEQYKKQSEEYTKQLSILKQTKEIELQIINGQIALKNKQP